MKQADPKLVNRMMGPGQPFMPPLPAISDTQMLSLVAAILGTACPIEEAVPKAEALVSELLERDFRHATEHAPIPGRADYKFETTCFQCQAAMRHREARELLTPRVQTP